MLFILALLSVPGAETATTSRGSSLTLGEYVRGYRARSNTLPLRSLDVDVAGVQIERRRQRGTQELGATTDLGGRLYHFTSRPGVDVVGEIGAIADYVWLGDQGTRLGITGRTTLPTSPVFGRTVQYGLDATFAIPMLRNFGGREFEYETEIFASQKRQAEALYANEELLVCADAIERFVVRYAAAAQLEAYRTLLTEKRRVWGQTSADYQRRMITRLDLLSAQSDWLLARSLEPTFAARAERADAALRAFFSLPAPTQLSEPPALFSAEPPVALEPASHPRVVALDAVKEAYDREMLLAREQGRDELDLRFSAGVDRFHDVFDPNGAGADATDVHGFVGVRYLLPIERPDIDFRVQILRIQLRQIEEQRADPVRELDTALSQSLVTRAREAEAYAFIVEQIEVLKNQIAAAYREFRAGKLEFQNYLDHWDRHQNAILSVWDRWLALRLAEIALIPLSNTLPEVCRAEAL